MNAHQTLNLRKVTALPPLKPSHLPCPLQTKASSPETLSRASSFQGSPSSIEALVSPETQNSCHCPQTQTPWQSRPPGDVSDPSCQVSSHVPRLNLGWHPPAISTHLCSSDSYGYHLPSVRGDGKAKGKTTPSLTLSPVVQTPARGQTSSAVRFGRAQASDLRLINTKITRKEVLCSSVGDRMVWMPGQFLDNWKELGAERKEGRE